MTCPGCAADLSDADFTVGHLGVCPSCARSLALEGAVVRYATSDDLRGLNDVQVRQLRKSRPSAWRDAVQATKARLKGR